MPFQPALFHVFPGFGCGGTQLRMVSILNSLGGAFRHVILALDGRLDASEGLRPGLDVELRQVPPAGGLLGRSWEFRRIIGELRPDLVLTYNWGAIEAVAGARIAGRCAVVHNECGFGPDEASRLKKRRVWTRWLLLRGLYRTVVTSRTMLEIARSRYRLPAHAVQLIPTGVDVRQYQPGRDPECRRRIGAAEDSIVFGYVGGLRPEKQLDVLLDAFHQAAIPGSKLVLVGSGPCRPQLQERARQWRIAGDVVFAGHAADPIPYLHACDVFAMSSATEQVSNAMLQAMACGLPVLCTDVGDSAALLGPEAAACVVRPGDTQGLARRMREFAADRGRRAAAGSANRARCLAHYSHEAMVSGYAALYHAAVRQVASR